MLIVLLASCDKDPTPTVYKGTIVMDSTGTAFPQASLMISPQERSNAVLTKTIENYEVPTDESGAFEFSVPGEIGGIIPSEIYLSVFTGAWLNPDDIYTTSGVDFIFEGDVGVTANAESFAPGKTYDFTIRLLR